MMWIRGKNVRETVIGKLSILFLEGVKENTGKALKYFIKAAEGGNERAAELLDSICNRQ